MGYGWGGALDARPGGRPETNGPRPAPSSGGGRGMVRWGGAVSGRPRGSGRCGRAEGVTFPGRHAPPGGRWAAPRVGGAAPVSSR
ncbi:hypothetical protein DI273_04350 [Streptomyces violascens]|nr:hypothetical protein DI273_04350 [Streptomyces violascens]